MRVSTLTERERTFLPSHKLACVSVHYIIFPIFHKRTVLPFMFGVLKKATSILQRQRQISIGETHETRGKYWTESNWRSTWKQMHIPLIICSTITHTQAALKQVKRRLGDQPLSHCPSIFSPWSPSCASVAHYPISKPASAG